MRFLLFIMMVITSANASAVYEDSSLPAFDENQVGKLFSLHGSNTIGAALAPQLAKDYLEAKGLVNVSINTTSVDNEYRITGYHKNRSAYLTIEVAAHGSSTAFNALEDGRAEIGMASRAIKPREVEALKELGDMNSFAAETVVAIDGIAIIAHPSNPVDSLTLDQVAEIFSGRIDDWQQLGAAPGKISLYARDDNSGTWDTFKYLVFRGNFNLHQSARRFESNDEISRLVRQDPRAIGFVGLAAVNRAKLLAVADNNTRALVPTHLTIATEDYPLSRRLFMYIAPSNNSPIIREFLEFVQSDAGQRRATKVGYIGQAITALPPKNVDQGQPEYLELIKNRQRLSVNIRFKEGSAELDNKAKRDILRVKQFMENAEHQNKKLLLIGFGDAKQSPRWALALSRLRAIAVRSALRDHGVHSLPVEGFGDSLPVADNYSTNRIRNQRVEIWL